MSSTAAPARRSLFRRGKQDGPRSRMRDLLPYIFEQRGVIAVVIVLSVVGAVASLAQPLIVGEVIARVQASTPLGTLVWLLPTERSQWWLVGLGSLVFAVGLAMLVAPITAAALQNAPERLAGIAAGVSNTTARVGGLVAVALLGVVLEAAYRGAGTPLTATGRRDPSIHAFRWTMVAAAALALAGALVGAVGFASRTSRGRRSGSAGRRSRRAAGRARA